jgi:hypothetical protein
MKLTVVPGGTNVAAGLAALRGRDHVFAILANYLGVIASLILILCAVFAYDLQRARASDGHLEWRDLFKGTTLAQAVPIISGIAVALASAISPILVHDLGDAPGNLFRPDAPQVSGAK